MKHLKKFNEDIRSGAHSNGDDLRSGVTSDPYYLESLTIEEFSMLREAMYAVKSSLSPSAFQSKEFFKNSKNFETVVEKLRRLLEYKDTMMQNDDKDKLDKLYRRHITEGVAEKAVRVKDKKIEINTDRKDNFRKKIKDLLKSQDCTTKQIGDDFEVHCCGEHVGQVMFRKDMVVVKKVGNKFPKEFGYNELGKIKSELSTIIKSCKK